MAPAKKRSRAQHSTPWVEYFRPYGIPPSWLHEALQNAAMEAGWTPPSKAERRAAGQKSGRKRKGRAELRRDFVKAAFEGLKPSYRVNPYADASIDALIEAYRQLATDGGHYPEILKSAPFKAKRETLKKDLKMLGIKSKRRKH
jgi:hypothetical protein